MCVTKKCQTTLNIFGPFFLTRHGKEKGNGEAAQQSSLTVVCVRETRKKKKKKKKEKKRGVLDYTLFPVVCHPTNLRRHPQSNR